MEADRVMRGHRQCSATQSWREALYAYLVPKCPYTRDELNSEMLRRVEERECSAMQLLDEFVFEALSGDLMPAR